MARPPPAAQQGERAVTVVLRADARRIPLLDETVDLIIKSPPYWNQRSYKDGGEHYDGQIGSEPTAQLWLEALWEVTAECWRVLKPGGSLWVNLGDKRSGSSAPGTTTGLTGQRDGGRSIRGQERVQGDRSGMVKRYDRVDDERRGLASGGRVTRSYGGEVFGRSKSKMLLPHRYAIGCEDGLADPDGIGWIVRQDQVWSKLNGLPESVDDRTADRHEYWFHLTKQGDYFAAIDELREPVADGTAERYAPGFGDRSKLNDQRPGGYDLGGEWTLNPLGRLPGSVWTMANEPLIVPAELAVEHFAAFPSEWPRRLILGWSPSGICVECAAPRRPVTVKTSERYRDTVSKGRPKKQSLNGSHGNGFNGDGYPQVSTTTTIVGEACDCTPFTDHPERKVRGVSDPKVKHRAATPDGYTGRQFPERLPVREYHLDAWTPPATRPSVVLDPFGGTGTTAMVARALGRTGISLDLSADYGRLARWRIFESGGVAKARERTNRDRQGVLL